MTQREQMEKIWANDPLTFTLHRVWWRLTEDGLWLRPVRGSRIDPINPWPRHKRRIRKQQSIA